MKNPDKGLNEAQDRLDKNSGGTGKGNPSPPQPSQLPVQLLITLAIVTLVVFGVILLIN